MQGQTADNRIGDLFYLMLCCFGSRLSIINFKKSAVSHKRWSIAILMMCQMIVKCENEVDNLRSLEGTLQLALVETHALDFKVRTVSQECSIRQHIRHS